MLDACGVAVAPVRAPSGNWIVMLDAEALKLVLDRLLATEGVDCRLHCTLVDAATGPDGIESVTLFDHAGRHEVGARAFVDGSGNGDLGFAAGVPAFAGANARDRQHASYTVRVGGVAANVNVDRTLLASLAQGFDHGASRAHLRRNGGHFLRLPRTDDLWWMGVDVATDGLDAADLTRAERDGRDLAWRFVERLRERMPGFERAFVSASGPQLGIRDSRQLATRYRMTDDDVLCGRTRDDGVACGCWPAELHAGDCGPTFQPVGGEGYYHLPLRALRAERVSNLWVAGRAIGCELRAFGSVRVMGTAFATGHAAGIAAALEAGADRGDDVVAVRAALIAQHALLY
jgi:hypothetical protein